MLDDINDMRDWHTLKYWPHYIQVDSLDFICFLLGDDIQEQRSCDEMERKEQREISWNKERMSKEILWKE